MNTVRILICVTFALLIAALVYSYTTKGNPNGTSDKTVNELEEELRKVRLQNQINREKAAQDFATYTPANTNTPPLASQTNNIAVAPPADFVNPLAPSTAEPAIVPDTTANIPSITDSNALPELSASSEISPINAAGDELAMLKAENERLKKQQAKQERENKMLNQEANAIQGELAARSKPLAQRATELARAQVMARVQIYDPESGIIVLDLERPQNIDAGQILGIRRGSAGGIIGRIKLSSKKDNIGYADPIQGSFPRVSESGNVTFNGPIDVKTGDEIIVIP